MLHSESSDIIQGYQALYSQSPALDLLQLKGGKVLAISSTTLCLYKNQESIGDPLGNGILAVGDWPEPLAENQGFVASHRAGAIKLHDSRIILITPVSIGLYANAEDALLNQNCLCQLNLDA